MKGKCRLTVFCVSYNFEGFIRDALEGFINQKTDFPFKVFVYDDASTDRTGEILKEYEKKYPELFDIYISPRNTYKDADRKEKILQLRYEHMEGEYIALCEGDDYWIDDLKLQKQVDFMDSHPECSLIVHASHWINYETNTEYDVFPYDETRFLTSEEVITQPGGNPPTASYVYRARDLIIEDIFHCKDVGDYPRQLYELTRGKIFYINKVMSIYRHRHSGSWSTKYYSDKIYAMRHFFDMQDFLLQYDQYTKGKYHEYVREKFFDYLYDAGLRDPDMPYEEYERLLESSEMAKEDNLRRYSKVRKRIGAIVRGTYNFNEQESYLLKTNQHAIIYGCGIYSQHIVRCLETNHIKWDGYVISDNQSNRSAINGKPVWRLCDYIYDFDDTVVIIGVGQNLKKVVMEALMEKNVKNIIDSFWVHEEDLIEVG